MINTRDQKHTRLLSAKIKKKLVSNSIIFLQQNAARSVVLEQNEVYVMYK